MLAELAVGLVLAASAGERTVPCAEVIQTVAFPYIGSSRYPSQLVLDAVSAPGRHLPQSSETGAPPRTTIPHLLNHFHGGVPVSDDCGRCLPGAETASSTSCEG